MRESKFVRPVNRRFVILVDDPDYTVENGIVVRTPAYRTNLDYFVVRGEGDGFGVGSRVIIDDPLAGRKIRVDGVHYRVVPVANVIGVVE